MDKAKAVSRLNPIDVSTICYLMLVAILAAVFGGGSASSIKALIINPLLALAAFSLARFVSEKSFVLLRLARDFYPIAFCSVLYVQSGELFQLFHPGFLDDVVYNWDTLIFGSQPSIEVAEMISHSQVITEFLHMCYFSYYLALFGVSLVLYLGSRPEYFRMLYNVCLAFFLCYLAFIFFPIEGPIPEREGLFSGFFPSLVEFAYRFDVPGGAFPSSHVAIEMVLWISLFRFSKKLAIMLCPLLLGLILSTVFCRFHYGIDALAGMFVPLVTIPIADYIWKKHISSTHLTNKQV